MRKQLWLTAAAVVLAAAAVGSTFASYVHAKSNDGQTIEAGRLELDLTSDTGGTLEPWSIGPLAPRTGMNSPFGVEYRYVVVKNKGNVDATLSYGIAGLGDLENGCVEPEASAGDVTCGDQAGSGELSGQLEAQVSEFKSVVRSGRSQCVDEPTGRNDKGATLKALAGGLTDSTIPVDHNSAVCLRFAFSVPDRTDNNLVQSDSSTFTVNLNLRSR